jgi:hypothetical protein
MALFFDLDEEKLQYQGYYYWQCCFYRLDQRNETTIYLKIDKVYHTWFIGFRRYPKTKERKKVFFPYYPSIIMNNSFFYLKSICYDLALSKVCERNKIKLSCKKKSNKTRQKSQSHICSCSQRYTTTRQRRSFFIIIIDEGGLSLCRLSLSLYFYTFCITHISTYISSTRILSKASEWHISSVYQGKKTKNFTQMKWKKKE